MRAREALTGRARALAMAAALALGLGACNSPGLGGFSENTAAPTPRVEPQPLAQPAATVGQTYGTGPVRVGLILPLTQNGNPSLIGQALANAAQMAIADGGAGDITLMVLDDRSAPDSAATAAQAEVKAGAADHPGAAVRRQRASGRQRGESGERAGHRVLHRRDRGLPTASICCRSWSRAMSTGSSISPSPRARRT